jgi:BirA family biotin operon repressor/biotin-[acetyl-CoA-carboxylase] ligase
MFYSDAPNPVSMAQILGHETDRDELLKVFLKVLPEALKREPEVLVSDYHSRLYRREGMHRFCDDKGVFEAKVLNVLDDGRLVLLDADGRARIYAFKEVGFCL